jgi:hypothetical protein
MAPVRRTCAMLARAVVTSLTDFMSTSKELADKSCLPDCADGFDVGSHSGRKAGGSVFDQFRKDLSRFEKDSQYAQGWSDGYRQCETEQEAAMRQARMAIEQRRLAEQRQRDKNPSQRELEREALKGVDVNVLKLLK